MNIQPLRSPAVAPRGDSRPEQDNEVPAAVVVCPFCGDPTPPGTRRCPRCLPIITVTDEPQAPESTAPVSPRENGVGAAYSLEGPTRCPHCAKDITTVRALRALRTQVSFTSTLPRKGYVIICPECTGMLSSGLAGMI
jgi:hypothetical protein